MNIRNKELQKKVNTIIIKDDISYPTIMLFICNTFFLFLLFIIKNFIPYFVYLLFASISLYINFTPFHESAHKLIAIKKYNYLNGLVGRASSFVYSTSYLSWKYIHNLHHINTNHEDDPDKFYTNIYQVLVLGPFLDMIYMYNYLKNIHMRPKMEVIESVCTYTLLLLFYFYIYQNNYSSIYFYYYYLPLRFALLYASLVLDFNAHHDCVTKKEDNIKSTNKVSGFFVKEDSPLLLSLFMQNQNYHNIHHLFPFIPFYKYQDIWNNEYIRTELIQKGTNEINIVPTMVYNSQKVIKELKDTIQS